MAHDVRLPGSNIISLWATPAVSDYPPGAFVTVSIEFPHHGRIVVREEGKTRVLWECDHDHPTGVEASACAGQEIGRSGRT